MNWLRHRTHRGPMRPCPTRGRHVYAEYGFTLHEVLIAMAIFSLGLLGLSSMQITAIKLNASANITTQIATVAQEQMENLLTVPLDAQELQDDDSAVGQGTTYCALYPPEGLRPCKDPTFASSFSPTSGRQFCVWTRQSLAGTACSDANFPPPTAGFKVLWSVDVDAPGALVQIAHITLRACRKVEGQSRSVAGADTTNEGCYCRFLPEENRSECTNKTFHLSFARRLRPPDGA